MKALFLDHLTYNMVSPGSIKSLRRWLYVLKVSFSYLIQCETNVNYSISFQIIAFNFIQNPLALFIISKATLMLLGGKCILFLKALSKQRCPLLLCSPRTEMRYCEISKEMLSLYFGLAVFCIFDARVPEFDMQPLLPQQLWTVQCTLYSEHCVKFWDSSFELPEYIKLKIPFFQRQATSLKVKNIHK